MNKRQIVLGLLLCATLFCEGCGKKIDASSEESFKKSMDKIRKSMSEEDAKEFAASCLAIIFYHGSIRGEDAYKALDGENAGGGLGHGPGNPKQARGRRKRESGRTPEKRNQGLEK